jgi:hypothetical protein
MRPHVRCPEAQASYGYTPYGEPDADLTKESDPADSTGATATKPEDPLMGLSRPCESRRIVVLQ